MKVKISEKESYSLDLPDEISFGDFRILVKKLEVVVSFVDGKETSSKQTSQGPKGQKGIARLRNDYIEILKAHFTLTPYTPEMEEVLKRYNVSYQTIGQHKYNWIKKYSIKAEEIGLPELPAPHKKQTEAEQQ